MRREFRFKPAVQATECVSRFRIFLTDHIRGQFVILNKPHIANRRAALSKESRMHRVSARKIRCNSFRRFRRHSKPRFGGTGWDKRHSGRSRDRRLGIISGLGTALRNRGESRTRAATFPTWSPRTVPTTEILARPMGLEPAASCATDQRSILNVNGTKMSASVYKSNLPGRKAGLCPVGKSQPTLDVLVSVSAKLSAPGFGTTLQMFLISLTGWRSSQFLSQAGQAHQSESSGRSP
jgi:hypothetical protein